MLWLMRNKSGTCGSSFRLACGPHREDVNQRGAASTKHEARTTVDNPSVGSPWCAARTPHTPDQTSVGAGPRSPTLPIIPALRRVFPRLINRHDFCIVFSSVNYPITPAYMNIEPASPRPLCPCTHLPYLMLTATAAKHRSQCNPTLSLLQQRKLAHAKKSLVFIHPHLPTSNHPAHSRVESEPPSSQASAVVRLGLERHIALRG